MMTTKLSYPKSIMEFQKTFQLFIGTQADNMFDASKKGRCHGYSMRGEANPASRLTNQIIIDARARYQQGESFHSLSRRYCIDRKTITHAIKGISWSYV